MPTALSFFLKVAFKVFMIHKNFRIVCSISVKNAFKKSCLFHLNSFVFFFFLKPFESRDFNGY